MALRGSQEDRDASVSISAYIAEAVIIEFDTFVVDLQRDSPELLGSVRPEDLKGLRGTRNYVGLGYAKVNRQMLFESLETGIPRIIEAIRKNLN